MKIKKKFEILQKWQQSYVVHPLTCRKDKCDGILSPKIHGGREAPFAEHIILHCPKCDYEQEYIPDYVFATKLDCLEKVWDKLFGEENENKTDK